MRPGPPPLAGFDPARFEGTWHIVLTNYAFWKTRTHPTVTYERLADRSGVVWRDTLRFRKGRERTLAGVDRQDPSCSSHFIWRGRGLFSLIRSPWWIVAVSDDYDWAVTWFGRSNVGTAPGMDVYSRAPSLPPETLAAILERVRRDPFLRERATGLFPTVQESI